MAETIVELSNVTKSYGKVRALDGVSMGVNKGEIVGLIGDNGAGKSTLIKIIAGVVTPDSGDIYVRGQKIDHWSAAKAHESGIETVFQDRALAVQQSVTRNIFMGREITGFLHFMNVKKQRAEAERLMREIGFTSKVFTPDSAIGTLSGGERQGVAIARALYFDAELIILDEPTTALSLTETTKVFNFMQAAKERGCSIVFIDHNIYHIYDLADRFVVVDRGKVVSESTKAEVTSADRLADELKAIARTGHVSV